MKRVNIHPDMLKPGASQSLTWDRCLRPTWATWVKEGDKAFLKKHALAFLRNRPRSSA
jgi:hypothetical protein